MCVVRLYRTCTFVFFFPCTSKFIDPRGDVQSICSILYDNGYHSEHVLTDGSQLPGKFGIGMINICQQDLFIAGSDTSAITTEWAMAELIRKPAVLEKARQELLAVIGTERPVQESDIHRLPYLQAIVKETMRLHPAAPLLLTYRAKADVEVLGYIVPKGIQVLVNAWAIGRDPSYWTESMEFEPERFLGSSVDFKGRDFEYIPFGAGRRICPGLPLAVRMVHLMVASLVQSFNWRLPDGMPPEDLDMEEQFGVTLRKAAPLCAIPTLG